MHDDNTSENTKACTDISEIRNKKNMKTPGRIEECNLNSKSRTRFRNIQSLRTASDLIYFVSASRK